ncbi:MAG: NapC/NirT family cytochrome c, partial [Nitrosomonadaceae bacterium]|nr:NapC/NirT family cytochrome c [Nitrosomonadaceae bacterium]MDW7618564.1 NapC/NirT family cytochrome c [Nitrosomonadaceae bacterium]MDW7647091.1 NapC/NirT family cytochrome c [Nitrosomonadaceae bacterium]MDW7665882.1 NapC/NirT family cytochrome c [Nitrosomonadaceae bacterium]
MTISGGKAGGTLLIGAFLGVVMVAVVFGGEAAVSTDQFCTSCHSMTYPAE